MGYDKASVLSAPPTKRRIMRAFFRGRARERRCEAVCTVKTYKNPPNRMKRRVFRLKNLALSSICLVFYTVYGISSTLVFGVDDDMRLDYVRLL